jgi:hypothetical protein
MWIEAFLSSKYDVTPSLLLVYRQYQTRKAGPSSDLDLSEDKHETQQISNFWAPTINFGPSSDDLTLLSKQTENPERRMSTANSENEVGFLRGVVNRMVSEERLGENEIVLSPRSIGKEEILLSPRKVPRPFQASKMDKVIQEMKMKKEMDVDIIQKQFENNMTDEEKLVLKIDEARDEMLELLSDLGF